MVDFTHNSTVMLQSCYSCLAQVENHKNGACMMAVFMNTDIINVTFIKINTVCHSSKMSSHIKENETMNASNDVLFEFIS